jgi:hypothetical protein
MLRELRETPRAVFAIPDVITSNTAPGELLARDPLAIVTEDGICYIDEGVSQVGGLGSYVSQRELEKQWLAKLYLHNTPHALQPISGPCSPSPTMISSGLSPVRALSHDKIYAKTFHCECIPTLLGAVAISTFDVDRSVN